MDADEAKLVRLSAWACLAFIVLFALTWGVLGRNIPPYSPDMPADELAAIFRDHASTMRIGYTVGAFVSSTVLIIWAIGLFRIMAQMERGAKLLSYTQLIGGTLTGMVPMLSCIFLLTAAFRPEQDPAMIRMLYDMGWLMIDVGFGVTLLQYCAFGVVALRDTRAKPLFPKWVAWLGIWISLEFLVELIMPYFRTGPFAWDGLFAYWIAFFGPFLWMTCIAVLMFKAATRLNEEYESEKAHPVSGPVAG